MKRLALVAAVLAVAACSKSENAAKDTATPGDGSGAGSGRDHGYRHEDDVGHAHEGRFT